VDAAYIFVRGRTFHGTGYLTAPRSGTTPTNQPRVNYLLTFVKINHKVVNMELFTWINTGLFVALAASFLALGLSLRAAARLGRLLRNISDLDWDSVAHLAEDVQKLKKQVQRYRNDENAQMKSLQKQALHQVADQVMMQPQQNVTKLGG
jgi:hypothetical protein